MKRFTRTLLAPSLTLTALCLTLPAPASADLVTVWAAATGTHVHGTGDIYKNFDKRYGGGIEGGIELLGIDLFGEALLLGTDQYLFTGNLGFDMSLGDDFSVSAGVFTGPMYFRFPSQPPPSFQLSDALSTQLAIAGVPPEQVIEAYNDVFGDKEKLLGSGTFGWNLARARLQIEVKLFPLVSIGLSGQAGYHLVISGEEAAAGAKDAALESLDAQYMLSAKTADFNRARAQASSNPEAYQAALEMYPQLNSLPADQELDPVGMLREELDARPVDVDSLNGINYSAGLFVKVEI